MDATEAHALGVKHGKKTVKAVKVATATLKPIGKLAVLGFGVLLLVGMVYPEVTKTQGPS